MAKIITRSEVNALVEGTFTTDLNKVVLYGEVSGNTNFIVESVNSVSDKNYTQNQALLSTDIRVSGDITVTLTPRQTTIADSATSIIFDITTGGTAGQGTPVYSIVTATYDGGAPTSSSINGTQVTVTFPANQGYSAKTIAVKVKAVVDNKEFVSNLSTVTQSGIDKYISLAVNGKVTASSGGTCNSFTVSWTGLTVGTIIFINPTNVSITYTQITVTASTGTQTVLNNPIVAQNTGETATLSLTATWRENLNVSDTVTWQQEGHYVPPTPPSTDCRFEFAYNGLATVHNNTSNQIEFTRVSIGSLSYIMALPTAEIGTGFDGKVLPLSDGQVGLTDETVASQTYSSEDNKEVQMNYQFDGYKEYDQEVILAVTYATATDQKTLNFTPNNGYAQILDLEDWFDSGQVVSINVSFEFTVSTPSAN